MLYVAKRLARSKHINSESGFSLVEAITMLVILSIVGSMLAQLLAISARTTAKAQKANSQLQASISQQAALSSSSLHFATGSVSSPVLCLDSTHTYACNGSCSYDSNSGWTYTDNNHKCSLGVLY